MTLSFLCPITQETMRDPVTDRDGNTFERAAIVAWLEKHGTSPVTRNPMTVDDLVPNRALREAIEAANLQPEPLADAATAPPADDADEGSTAISIDCLVDSETAEVVVSIKPSDLPATERFANDVVCVIDISGSMGDAATVKDAKGNSETDGLNLLDIVKHATRTIGGLLGPKDRLSVVTFTDNAAVVLPLTLMDDGGKKELERLLEAVEPQGMTNLWAGLHLGMEQLRGRPHAETSRTASVLLLTDGQPNVEPPRGHIPSLERYVDQFEGGAPFTVSTFGFGYNLDSKLLCDIAVKTGGMYVFIPDSGLVGTVFVNTVANVLCTAATAVTISIDSGRPILNAMSLLTVTGSGAHGFLGTVHFGQTRDISFQLGDADSKFAAEPPMVRVAYKYAGKAYVKTVSARVASGSTELLSIKAHSARREFAKLIADNFDTVLNLGDEGIAKKNIKAKLDGCIEKLRHNEHLHLLIAALVKDLSGEITLALTKDDNFSKWGRHFLPSIVRATLMQQCNNFKDHSVQLYGGKMFKHLQDSGEVIFTKITPPKPSRRQVAAAAKTRGGANAAAAPAKPVSMTRYYNCHGGCVLGSCMVPLADGTVLPAREVSANDVLADASVVRLVVRIRVPLSGMPMMKFAGGLAITEFHPVRVNGVWQFPVNVAAAQPVTAYGDVEPFVYTFVLDGGHSLIVNGVEVVSLAHNLHGDVVGHEYLGTDRIVEDLAKLPGFDEGCVTVDGFQRHPVTKRVCGLLGAQ